ncbi:JAB1/Mov34/MPN/PAD-1 ubiquitin protease-domain-containing protein [Pyronema domesticum]|uniref:COP9 signalosome complex subunit 5 n=1 Tax=Pyronema omphalodes (strain CBS 100304) TaxID=1076935 RepID=U4LH23_PYROM|nr:JAB1/Mov34/MPN/PAD-1 ubiquitin protease-domain-containing protein [Pyronema domesticum]CCX31218.1 Similar to COP9 signalosome complex subunit 5; acc. no. Q4IJM4 [Pyronema omphalodes CBS 100304]
METSARTQLDLENISLVDPSKDGLYSYDLAEQNAIRDAKPWAQDPHYFKYVRISAVALMKMVMHARSGGSIEIMGLMQGKIAHETFVVMDVYRLPVEGTETRVSAHDQAYEYMAEYNESTRSVGRNDNVIGWYHSHPGYGCWLSGIDVGTQKEWQQFMDPFLAVVVDPDRTISAGKVDIGAFRTYPENYKAPNTDEDAEYQAIPLSKIEDFGAHSSSYYPMEVTHFKSTLDTHLLDLLWNKYWVATLSQSPLVNNREYSTKQMLDLSQKITKSEGAIAGKGRAVMHTKPGNSADLALQKVVKESNKITLEEISGFMSNVVKERIFTINEPTEK